MLTMTQETNQLQIDHVKTCLKLCTPKAEPHFKKALKLLENPKCTQTDFELALWETLRGSSIHRVVTKDQSEPFDPSHNGKLFLKFEYDEPGHCRSYYRNFGGSLVCLQQDGPCVNLYACTDDGTWNEPISILDHDFEILGPKGEYHERK